MYKVTVTIENLDGVASTHVTEYDNEPLLLAVEVQNDSLKVEMAEEYNYWRVLFHDQEFNLLTNDPIT